MNNIRSLTRRLSAIDELSYCMFCASAVFVGNVWNQLIAAPATVTVAYAAVSGAFIAISMVTAMSRQVLQTHTSC